MSFGSIESSLMLCFNSDRERHKEEVKKKTVSLWSYMNASLDEYKNPLYCRQLHARHVLLPVASIRYFTLKFLLIFSHHIMHASQNLHSLIICHFQELFFSFAFQTVQLPCRKIQNKIYFIKIK
jgi:hypothetical protein